MHRNDPKAITAVRGRAAGWFALADSVSSFCAEFVDRVNPNTDDGQQVLSAVLLRRMMSSFEAVILLAERGMHTEGLVQRRSMLEALFVLGSLWLQPTTAQEYVKNDLHRRRDIYKNLLKASSESRARVSGYVSIEQLQRMVDDLSAQTKGVTYLSVEQFAQRAKLHDIFLTDYCLLSEAAHHAARDLERHLITDATNNIEAIIWGVEPEPPFKLLFPAIDQMLMGVHVIAQIFCLDVKAAFDGFSRESRRLSDLDGDG